MRSELRFSNNSHFKPLNSSKSFICGQTVDPFSRWQLMGEVEEKVTSHMTPPHDFLQRSLSFILGRPFNALEIVLQIGVFLKAVSYSHYLHFAHLHGWKFDAWYASFISVSCVRHSMMCADVPQGFWLTGLYVNSVLSSSNYAYLTQFIRQTRAAAE